MFPDIIDFDAERRLISFLDRCGQEGRHWDAIHLGYSDLRRMAPDEEMREAVVGRLIDGSADVLATTIVFLFKDGDVVAAWTAAQEQAEDESPADLRDRFRLPDGTRFGDVYDLLTDNDAVRALCYRKIAGYTDTQISDFKALAQHRKERARPEILIVEDQPFSSKLLVAMLSRTHKVHVAQNAETALELYRTRAPDIVLLDFELPDVDGDTLAGMIAALDPECHIIMVTANSRRDAVASCRRNGVRGYILKPYTKQKIMQGIEQFEQEQKLAS